MPSPLLIVVVVIVLVALDAGVRRIGGYASTVEGWRAGWRALPSGRREPSPYREGAARVWVRVAKAGIPRAASFFLPPVLGVVLLWSLATVLALGDFADVVRGTRSFAFVLASLALCITRALAGGATLLGAWDRRSGLFSLASALALGLDAALAFLALPCSDHRADDVRMALAGGVAQAALALGFAVSLWGRRGLSGSERPSLPPDDLSADELNGGP